MKLSPLLAQLVSQVPPQRGPPAGQAAAARRASGPSFRLLALLSWLVTVGLGAWMLAQWIARGGLRRAGDSVLPPQVTIAHFGLAVAGLLAWIVYLATGSAAVGWAASAILLPVAGLGMALVLWLPERGPVAAAPVVHAVPTGPDVPTAPADPAALADPADPADSAAPAGPGPPPGRHPPAVIVAAHGVFAVATILFAFLAAVGSH